MRRRRRREIVYRRVGERRGNMYRLRRNRAILRAMVFMCAALFVVLVAAGILLFGGREEGDTTGSTAASPFAGVNGLGAPAESQPESQAAAQPESQTAAQPENQTGTQPENFASPSEEAGDGWDYRGRKRPKVKGIYVTGPMAGSGGFDGLLDLLDETELNTMVIDVKNDSGEITYRMDLETAQTMGACINYVGDMEALLTRLKEHGVYTIARIVCFKDPYLAKNRPELALKTPEGKAVVDGNGLAWVNPYKEEVWEYLTAVAIEAGKVGFDEIQFDYVRFPIGSTADAADYGVDMSVYTKQQAITGFLNYASEKLHAADLPVTADVFGTIIGNETDVRQVGQDYGELGGIIDVLCPMVYPSHYGNGVFGLQVPDAQPYETVHHAMADSVEELSEVPEEKRALVRPWLQAFTATWVQGHISYGGQQIRQQIQAVYDAGYEEWILWNASNRYSADGLESGVVG